jgi:hypothetical protein
VRGWGYSVSVRDRLLGASEEEDEQAEGGGGC